MCAYGMQSGRIPEYGHGTSTPPIAAYSYYLLTLSSESTVYAHTVARIFIWPL